MLNALDQDRSTVAEGPVQYGPQEGNFPMGEANLPPLDRAADFRMRLQAIAERKEVPWRAATRLQSDAQRQGPERTDSYDGMLVWESEDFATELCSGGFLGNGV